MPQAWLHTRPAELQKASVVHGVPITGTVHDSSVEPLQLSSTPLQISAGGSQAVGQLQAPPHVFVPIVMQPVMQDVTVPRQQL
jgi:hypothetical protein